MALGTTNISTTLVGTTLRTSSRDVGTLCTHPAINKLSRYKPVRIPVVVTTANWEKGQINTDYYNGKVNYGISKPSRTLGSNENKIGDAPVYVPITQSYIKDKWEYIRPNGGTYPTGNPYRLGDFRGYEHAKFTYGFSHSTFPVLAHPHALRSNANTIDISCMFYYHKDENQGLLGLSQIFDSTNPPHFGIIARHLNKDANGNNVASRYNINGMPPCSVGYYDELTFGEHDSLSNGTSTLYRSFTMPIHPDVLTAQTPVGDRNMFHAGEWIEVIPVVAIVSANDASVVNVFSIQNPDIVGDMTYIYKIPTSPLDSVAVEITNMSATFGRTNNPVGYSTGGYSLIWLDTLSINITKATHCDEIIFINKLYISPTSSVNMPEITDGDIEGTITLATGTTSATLSQSIIDNYGTGVHNPYMIVQIPSNQPYNVTLGLEYLKDGWKRTLYTKTFTVQ